MTRDPSKNREGRPRPALRWWSALCLGAAAAACASGVGPAPSGERQPTTLERETARTGTRGLDALHYALRLRLAPPRIDGTLRLDARATRELDVLVLDLAGLDVTAVRDGAGAPLEFTQRAGELAIARPAAAEEVVVVEVDYGGVPARGLWYVGDPVDHCFTQGECEDARAWFPCLDVPSDRATSELEVDLPAGWTSVSGGVRLDARDVDGRRVERWRMTVPHPTYLTTLVAGALDVVREASDGLPLTYAAPRAGGPWRELLAGSLAATPGALAFLEELTGRPFPYEKYATSCVGDFPFGGMENASATTLTLAALRTEAGRRDASADALVVHEAAHQWFGDLLTCAEWPEIWLNEGFATYVTLLWFERLEGAESFALRARDAAERYLEGDRKTPRALVHREYVEPLDLFFSGHAYQGGATRLHLLRYVLGDDVFLAGLRRYVGRNQHRSVTSSDLQRALEEASGADLARFFEQWVHSPGHPVVDASWRYDASRERVLLRVEQVQRIEGGVPAAFEFPAEVTIGAGAGIRARTVQVDARRHLFEVPCAEEPRWVVLDGAGRVPAEVRLERGTEEARLVALEHPSAVARRAALRELGAAGPALPDAALAALAGALRDDEVEGVRVAAAAALGALRAAGRAPSSEAEAALEEIAVDGAASPALRRAALEALAAGGVTDPGRAALARGVLDDASASWSVRGGAARLLLRAAADPLVAYRGRVAPLIARADADDPHGALAAELIAALAALDDVGVALAAAQSAAGDVRLPRAARAAGIALLGKRLGELAPADSAARGRALVEALGDRDPRLRLDATRALAALVEADWARDALTAYGRRAVDPRTRNVIEGAFAAEVPGR